MSQLDTFLFGMMRKMVKIDKRYSIFSLPNATLWHYGASNSVARPRLSIVVSILPDIPNLEIM